MSSPGIIWPLKIQDKSASVPPQLEVYDFILARGGHLFRYLETEQNGNIKVSFLRSNDLRWIGPEDIIRKLSDTDKVWLKRRQAVCSAAGLSEESSDCQFLLDRL